MHPALPRGADGVHRIDSPLGPMVIAWRGAALVRVQLLGPDLAPSGAATPPAWVHRAADRITAVMGGAPDDLRDLPLDLTGLPPFARRVYEALRQVPPGATCTYGELAAALGTPGAARAVGGAVGRNPFLVVVPCHRVVAAGGRLGGFSAPGGVATKRALLAAEGVTKVGGRT